MKASHVVFIQRARKKKERKEKKKKKNATVEVTFCWIVFIST